MKSRGGAGAFERVGSEGFNRAERARGPHALRGRLARRPGEDRRGERVGSPPARCNVASVRPLASPATATTSETRGQRAEPALITARQDRARPTCDHRPRGQPARVAGGPVQHDPARHQPTRRGQTRQSRPAAARAQPVARSPGGTKGRLRALAGRFDHAGLSAWSQVQLGILALVRGRPEEARALLDEGLELSLATHSTRNVTLCLSAFAQLAFDPVHLACRGRRDHHELAG
jgi:hypothetical protein